MMASAANAGVLRVTETNFNASAGLITFSEFGIGTVNPVYSPADYGGDADSPTVTFGGYFLGQSLSADPATDCPGAAATGCIVGVPSGPLSLDPDAPTTFITPDGANPTSPVLSGSPTFNGPIAVLFDVLQVGVGFDAGFFDDIGSTGITAFDIDGNTLGTVVNEGFGIEFLGLVSELGDPVIAGVFLDLVGVERAGFAIDNLRFGAVGDVILPNPIPVPGAVPLFLVGLAGLRLAKRSKSA